MSSSGSRTLSTKAGLSHPIQDGWTVWWGTLATSGRLRFDSPLVVIRSRAHVPFQTLNLALVARAAAYSSSIVPVYVLVACEIVSRTKTGTAMAVPAVVAPTSLIMLENLLKLGQHYVRVSFTPNSMHFSTQK